MKVVVIDLWVWRLNVLRKILVCFVVFEFLNIKYKLVERFDNSFGI